MILWILVSVLILYGVLGFRSFEKFGESEYLLIHTYRYFDTHPGNIQTQMYETYDKALEAFRNSQAKTLVSVETLNIPSTYLYDIYIVLIEFGGGDGTLTDKNVGVSEEERDDLAALVTTNMPKDVLIISQKDFIRVHDNKCFDFYLTSVSLGDTFLAQINRPFTLYGIPGSGTPKPFDASHIPHAYNTQPIQTMTKKVVLYQN